MPTVPVPETELNEDMKLAIEATIRNQRLEERKATLRERLREGVEITIDSGVWTPTGTANVPGLTSLRQWATGRSAGVRWRA